MDLVVNQLCVALSQTRNFEEPKIWGCVCIMCRRSTESVIQETSKPSFTWIILKAGKKFSIKSFMVLSQVLQDQAIWLLGTWKWSTRKHRWGPPLHHVLCKMVTDKLWRCRWEALDLGIAYFHPAWLHSLRSCNRLPDPKPIRKIKESRNRRCIPFTEDILHRRDPSKSNDRTIDQFPEKTEPWRGSFALYMCATMCKGGEDGKVPIQFPCAVFLLLFFFYDY